MHNHRFLIEVARSEARTSSLIEAPQGSSVDWDEFLRRAESHGLLPIAGRHLRGASGIPNEIRTELMLRVQANVTRALTMVADLLSVRDALEKACIDAVPFKGPSLAALAYGDVGLRQSSDLDLMVRKGDVLRARAILAALGFVGGPGPASVGGYLRYSNELTLLRPWDGLIVELQWAPAPRYFAIPLDVEPMFGRLTRLELGGGTLPAFASEDLLLLLLIHGAKHLWERLIWIRDIVELVKARPGLEWDRVIRPAREARILRMVLVGLRLARCLHDDLPLPEEVLREMRADPRTEALARRLWARTLSRDPSAEDPPFRMLDVSMREDIRDAAAYCWRLATTPTEEDREWLRLPRSLSWAYRPLRPARLGYKYGRRALSRPADD